MNRYTIYFALCMLIVHINTLHAQVLYPDSEYLEYYRILEIKNEGISNRMNIFPTIVSQYNKDSITWNPWKDNFQLDQQKNKSISLLPARLTNHYNSTYAHGYNDGALWKGKGYTGSIQGGVTGKYGLLEFTIAPIVFFSQNSAFELAPQTSDNNPYNYQFTNKRIDYVQRYGDQSFAEFDLGQTDIRLVYKSFTIGASTQNIVWGPAQRNPILLSNNSSGIPHIDIGTHKPVNTKIGRFEGKIYYGLLKKSDYFDEDTQWNHRYWSGFSASYNPSFLPSLYLGFNRVLYKKAKDFVPLDLLVFITNFDDNDGVDGVNDEYDQMGSITMRWFFREVGFETYLEFAKNDFGGKLYGTEPDHSRGYTLGFSKYIDLKNKDLIKLTYEHATLDQSKSNAYRATPTWYAHHIVKQGYTQKGQILGAGIGPGSSSDYFNAQYVFATGILQLTAQRIRFNDDYFYDTIKDENRHDHEWTLESTFSKFIGNYLVGMHFGMNFRQNMYYVENNDKTNVSISLNLSKNF
ncbi:MULTISPECIES: capsule assembly Wzi family protein [Reichenbachiella]|uniref:capsule assembly Wzi family protein n=1 Tax=Reichenbachiella TaxID=156993 RepID=UPI000E6C8B1E|nr:MULTISPECIES: capsule assembly Wzi family protein [Reichenbachiella]MBU2912399.1 capsule assembly Wzi family protein [Reichenbachiella agariperforans]